MKKYNGELEWIKKYYQNGTGMMELNTAIYLLYKALKQTFFL